MPIRVEAFAFKQDGVNMYAGIMKVGDILKVAKVDVYRKEGEKELGYQRVPEAGRARKVATYLRRSRKALMPLSVLLSLRDQVVRCEESDKRVILTIPDDVTLWIVDGQHRLAGFKVAIEDEGVERLRDYPLPVVIMQGLSTYDEADQFRVINETMKKVRTDLARRILAMRFISRSSEARRELIQLDRMWEAISVEVIEILNTRPDSPWRGRIQPPNVRKQPSHTVREISFSTSLKPILKEWPYRTWRAQRVANILIEYWKAWQDLVPEAFSDAQDYVLLKTPGVFSLHELAYFVLEVLRSRGIDNPSKDDFKDILADLGDFATPQFWAADNEEGAAMAGSMKGFGIIADTLRDKLIDAGHDIG